MPSSAPAKPVLELYQRAKVIQSTIVEQAAFEWLGRVNHAYPCRIAMLDQLNMEEQNRLVRADSRICRVANVVLSCALGLRIPARGREPGQFHKTTSPTKSP